MHTRPQRSELNRASIDSRGFMGLCEAPTSETLYLLMSERYLTVNAESVGVKTSVLVYVTQALVTVCVQSRKEKTHWLKCDLGIHRFWFDSDVAFLIVFFMYLHSFADFFFSLFIEISRLSTSTPFSRLKLRRPRRGEEVLAKTSESFACHRRLSRWALTLIFACQTVSQARLFPK